MKLTRSRTLRSTLSASRAAAACGLLAVLLSPPLARAADYEVTFNATWSAATHPQSFPPGPHFSPLIGGTHDAGVTFWEVGGLATVGIERMAELGSTTNLLGEVQTAINAGSAFSDIQGGGTGSPGTARASFTIAKTHPLVTMIAPSPDWFVGVNGLELRRHGSWLDMVSVDLDPYDAGTDSGPNFTSGNNNTNPADPISEITGFPFTNTPPLGTFTFQRVPEPSGFVVLSLGAMLAARRRR